MPDFDPPLDDPLGDISTVVHAAERLATWVVTIDSLLDSGSIGEHTAREDARTILAVAKRLKGRL